MQTGHLRCELYGTNSGTFLIGSAPLWAPLMLEKPRVIVRSVAKPSKRDDPGFVVFFVAMSASLSESRWDLSQ
jgi:hypothetical protein